MPDTKHFDDLLGFPHAINDAVWRMDDFPDVRIRPFRQYPSEPWVISQKFQFSNQRQPEVLGGGWIIFGDESNPAGQVLVCQFGYEDFESHVLRFFSTSS